jgi:hypothetical protein
MVATERATLAEFNAVLPLLERFFAEEGFDTPRTQSGRSLLFAHLQPERAGRTDDWEETEAA